jgi:hypothetical protein
MPGVLGGLLAQEHQTEGRACPWCSVYSTLHGISPFSQLMSRMLEQAHSRVDTCLSPLLELVVRQVAKLADF